MEKKQPMSNDPKFTCTGAAWDYGLPLQGTATRGDIWLLIEYPDRWEAKAFERSGIAENIKSYIQALTTPEIRVRPLLIRQPESKQLKKIKLFVAQTNPLSPRLYEYHLDRYADILDLDLPRLVLGQPGDPAHLRAKPIYLVCTNGRRDRCCSVYGPATYTAMVKEAGDRVWQSSHIGGHNKAPTILFFPHGVNYGRATPSEARRLVRAYQRKTVVLHHYRGRVCFDTHAQAAEHFWREQTGVLDLPGLRVESIVEMGTDQWAVTISDLEGGRMEAIQIKKRESDFKIPVSCSMTKESSIPTFHRIG
jgi:hypothetical protein